MHQICFTLPGKRICIPILEPWPPIQWPRPDPGPWIEVEGVKPELVHDLQRVAALHDLASGLNPEVGRPVMAALESALGSLKRALPKGYEVTMGERKA